MRTALVSVLVVMFAVRAARASEQVQADVVAVNDDLVLIDVHGTTNLGVQRGWLVLSRHAPNVQRFWRELPKELGKADCDAAMNQFSKLLEEQNVGGVLLDGRQCRRNDQPFWAAQQPLLEGKPVAEKRFLTSATLERLRATRYGMAFGPFIGARWQGRFTGKYLNLTRDRLAFASMPTGLSPTPATGWVVVGPSGALVVAFDAEYGGFQLWTRDGPRWKSLLLVNALDRE